jgi:hypothetical protein
VLERLLERPGTTRIARPAHDVIAAVGAVTASRASHVLAVVLVLMSAGSESGGARGDWPPWPEGWCGKPWGPRQPARRAFPCVGRACAAIRKWHQEGKLCQRMCDETCEDAEGKWQRMCARCANEEDAASTGSRQHCATLACTHARPRARAPARCLHGLRAGGMCVHWLFVCRGAFCSRSRCRSRSCCRSRSRFSSLYKRGAAPSARSKCVEHGRAVPFFTCPHANTCAHPHARARAHPRERVHIHVHVPAYTCKCAYTCTYTRAHTCTRMPVRLWTHTHALFIHARAHMHTAFVHAPARLHAHARRRIHAQTWACAHACAHMCAHVGR